MADKPLTIDVNNILVDDIDDDLLSPKDAPKPCKL